MELKTSWTIIPLLFSISLSAQTSLPSTTNASAKEANRPIPFHGMVSAVDQKNKTFTINGKQATRLFKVTDKTSITKGAITAALKDIAVNEEVSGAYWKNPDGSFEAKMVRLGPIDKKIASPTPKPSATSKT